MTEPDLLRMEIEAIALALSRLPGGTFSTFHRVAKKEADLDVIAQAMGAKKVRRISFDHRNESTSFSLVQFNVHGIDFTFFGLSMPVEIKGEPPSVL